MPSLRPCAPSFERTKPNQTAFQVAVIGNPCDHPEQLSIPFTQPFDKRETTILRDAREVRCSNEGELIGATMSDHGR
jgi:hypothetical protein